MKISSAGFGLFLGAGFRLSPKELLRRHAPMNGNIVTVNLPDLNPVNQLGDHQMLGFIAGIIKAGGPGQHDRQWRNGILFARYYFLI